MKNPKVFRRANYGWLCAPIQGHASGDEIESAPMASPSHLLQHRA